MYVWELVAIRLQDDGWDVRHERKLSAAGQAVYKVVFQRPGFSGTAEAPNLPEAYALASRRANEYLRPSPQRGIAAPHFLRLHYTARG